MNEMINRRSLLQATGALIVTFGLVPGPGTARPAPVAKTVSPDRVDGFLAIDIDGRVLVYSGKVDLGTGVRTALTQIVAEELDVPMNRVTVVQGDTALTPDQGTTSGSLSIQNGGMQLRRAAATARCALLQKAAAELKLDVSALAIHDGSVIAKNAHNGARKLPIGTLVSGMSLALKLDDDAPQKTPADYTIVGKPVPRLDIPDKVSGRFTYMQDFKLPGMLHGRVIRPSGIGAALVSYDETSIDHIPGVVKVVRISNFLGVVAETEWSAIRAAQQLSVVWSKWEGLPEEAKLWEHVRGTRIVRDDATSNVGASATALSAAPRKFSATYDFAIHTHGSIGPSCAIASFVDGKLTCWTASPDCGQIINPDGLRNQIEGCIVQTVSRSLKEKVTFDRSMVTSLDWASYPILTFLEIPDVVIELIDRPNEPAWGGGEPACAVVPSAIGSAVFEATGARLRSVPFTPAKVKAALDAA
jgi:CO/xanthine dehydrogenase Mo-binding subunit